MIYLPIVEASSLPSSNRSPSLFQPSIFPGGHYIAYCQNVINGQWYEFDDQYVTEVHEMVVQNAEAYVLFYRSNIRPNIQTQQNSYRTAEMEDNTS